MRHLNRTAVAVVMVAVLLAAAAPAVQARPLAKPQAPSHLTGDWLSTALSWLGHFFDRAPQTPEARQKKNPSGDPSDPGPGSPGTYGTFGGGGGFTGNCIDPNGCFDGGGN